MTSLGSLSRERWQELEPLLDAALEVDPARRPAFLDRACGGDLALRAELRSLLAACDLGANMLETPAAITYAPLLAEEPEPVPTLLGGRYHIVREIGRGGMATVYLAEDPKHGRQVAVKTLRSELARRSGRARFEREIEIAAGLSHPHILPLHDSGEECTEGDEPPLLYFVSPFAGGETLRDRLRREPRLPQDEVIRLGAEVARALDYAHRRGIVHLDIKPENILLQEGHAVIADFGIARAVSEASEPDGAGAILGTPSYMSPEQATGAPDVDGRSDIYSLGCVLYELITGAQPFGRQTIVSGDNVRPDPEALSRLVSDELANVVLQAMAPSPDDRFATAGALASALAGADRPSASRRWRRARLTIVAATVAAALPAGYLFARSRASLDADLVAVAPFDVETPTLALWKEGLVDVMSRNLDGAGSLRTVPASDVVRRWHGRADARSAQALGRATGARLVLFGGLLRAGDSVRASVNLLDAATGRTLAEIEQRDVLNRIDRLSDSVTIALLREVGRLRGSDFARVAQWPRTSLGALKAYLQGEQFYRAALWDSAQLHFERAVALDTTFALAYHRLASVRRWRDSRDVPDSATYALMRQPSRYTGALGPHERLLATIDSLSAESYFAWRRGLQAGDYAAQESLVRRLYATLESALRRYPNDAELRFLYADAHSRYDDDVIVGEVDDRATLALYDSAIALDSSFAPAYVTPIALAAYLDGAESARRYIRGYLARAPSGPRSDIIRLDDVLLDSRRAAAIDVRRLVDSLPTELLCDASRLLRHLPDSAEMALRIARALSARPADSAAGSQVACTYSQIANALQFRGHLREAYRLTQRQLHWLRPTVMYNLARAGIVPPETARVEFSHVLALAPRTMMTKLYGWWASDGDTLAIESYIERFIEAQRRSRTPSGLEMLRASATMGRAYLSLARGDTTFAIEQLLTARDTLHECWADARLTLAHLLIARGRYREASTSLARRWPGTTSCSNGFDDVVWTMERARVFDRLGRRDEAAREYAFVVEAWRNADPELQPVVRGARDALARLEGRRRN
jgi:serine/threonine-protein kinase